MASGEFQVRENFCFPSGENYVGTYVAVQRAGETATICSVKKEGALDTVLTKLCGRPDLQSNLRPSMTEIFNVASDRTSPTLNDFDSGKKFEAYILGQRKNCQTFAAVGGFIVTFSRQVTEPGFSGTTCEDHTD